MSVNTTPKPRTYGTCPDCHTERAAVVEKVDGFWRYRLACGCNPPLTPEPKESE